MPDRRSGLGASDVPIIAGASPWATPVALWLDRMGLATQDETPAMSAGKALEGSIISLAASQTGDTIHRNRVRFHHPDWPRVPLWATPDGFTRPRRSLVEVKMVGHRFADWADGPPSYVGLQVQAQLACLPRVETALVAALIGGELRLYRIEREDLVQQYLPALVAEWWSRHVLGERAPDPDGPGDRWALLRVAASADGRATRVATADEADLASQLLALQRHADEVAGEIEQRRLALAEAARAADLRGDGWSARWGTRRTTDWAGVAADLAPDGVPPDLIEARERVTATFTFRRTKADQAEGMTA